MQFKITEKCIIEEYLNNWFTYEELSQYLCIDVNEVINVLTDEELIISLYNKNKYLKVLRHTKNIITYNQDKNCDNKKFSDDDLKIIEVADYIIKNRSSIRKTADFFEIGKTTVHDYITEKLPEISLDLYKQVFEIMMEHKSYDINNINIIKQVQSSYELLEQGLSSEEIQNALGISRNVLQRNLTTRLKKLDNDKYNKAKQILADYKSEAIAPHRFGSNK